MDSMNDARILIVGAGPTGLTAGLELARRGIVPDIIDRKEQASTLSRAVGILPRSLDILRPSGVTEKLLEEGIKLENISLYRGRTEAFSFSLNGGHPNWEFGLALAQDRTESILHDAFVKYGGRVKYSTELQDLNQNSENVFVTTADGMRVEYDYVIGADGVQSITRKALGIDFIGFDLPETWSIADVDAPDWENHDRFTMCMLPGGKVVVVAPLERTRFRVISNTADALKTLPLRMHAKNIRRKGTFKISIRQVANYSVGRVFLAGDAAHCHSPAGGRGMNLGIADAAELAGRFANNTLDGYSVSRYADGKRTIAASEQIRKVVASKNPIVRGTLVLGLAFINQFPFTKKLLAKRFLSD
ncbi:MAG: pentachlorophenol monooxygenase [Pyrinomonadaceae bacterium]|nr:pentachlorophenol monooxygenase [Pyrinomonadaceae bacterium]